MLRAPAHSPKAVTCAGSPPYAAMFSRARRMPCATRSSNIPLWIHTITGNAAGRGRRIRRSLGTPTAEVKVLKPQRWHA